MDSGLGIGGRSKSVVAMTTSKLDIKSPYVMEEGVVKSHVIELQPNSSTLTGPIDFDLKADPEKWTDMETVVLKGKVGIQVKKGNKWESVAKPTNSSSSSSSGGSSTSTTGSTTGSTTTKWGVINNTFASLISSCVIKINDCAIGDTTEKTYAYMTYIQTLLGTSASNAGSNILEVRNFIKDKPGHMKEPDLTAGSPFDLRRQDFLDRDMVDFVIPIHNDLMNAEKYIPPNTKLSFHLKKSDDNFVIWKEKSDTNEYRFVFEDIVLRIERYEVVESLMKAHNRDHVIGKQPYSIKYTKNLLKTFNAKGSVSEMKEGNLFFGAHLPDRVYMMFVDQEAFDCSPTMNPYNFETCDMRKAILKLNGVPFPEIPYEFEAGVNEKDLYMKLLANTGTGPFEMDSVNVSFKEFKDGYFIVAFDRSPTRDNGLYLHKPMAGYMSIVANAGRKLGKNYEVLVYGSYDSALTFVEDKCVDEPIF